MQNLEHHNRREIEALNQRGGRTLSIVDLILAGTIGVQIAAHVGAAVGRGGSFLTAANPGGAGKTALLAALLGFLPPNLPIVAVDCADVIASAEPEAGPHCYLAHEIGPGHWYGYIWGPIVGRYLALADGPHTVASCLHADTHDEVADAILACSILDPPAALRSIDFILFMHMDAPATSSGYRRRVSAVYQRQGEDAHRPVYRWKPEADDFESLDAPALDDRAQALADLLQQLTSSNTRDFAAVRRAYLEFIR